MNRPKIAGFNIYLYYNIMNCRKTELTFFQKHKHMPTVRLHQIQKETNLGLYTIVDFLRGYGFDIEKNLNSCVPEEARELCLRRFSQKKDSLRYTEKGVNLLLILARTLGHIMFSIAISEEDEITKGIDDWDEIKKEIVDDDFADYSRYIIDSFSYYTSKYRDIFGDSIPVLERLNYLERLEILGTMYEASDMRYLYTEYSFAEAVSDMINLKRRWNECSKHKFNTQFDRRLFDSYEKICKIYSECLVFLYLKKPIFGYKHTPADSY